MTQKIPEKRTEQQPFPVEKNWEELRPSREIQEDTSSHDPNLTTRIEVLKFIGRRSGEALPDGLIVEPEQLLKLIKPLRLNRPEPLVQSLFQTAGRYLRPQHQRYFGTNAANAKSQLDQLVRAAIQLDSFLDSTAIEIFGVIEQAHAALQAGWQRSPHLSANKLSQDLTAFIQAAGWVEASIQIAAHRPAETMRKQALMDAAWAIEVATGRQIKTGWAKSGSDAKDHFKGDDGGVLLAFMKLIEPKAREGSLVRKLRAARSELARARSSEKSQRST